MAGVPQVRAGDILVAVANMRIHSWPLQQVVNALKDQPRMVRVRSRCSRATCLMICSMAFLPLSFGSSGGPRVPENEQ